MLAVAALSTTLIQPINQPKNYQEHPLFFTHPEYQIINKKQTRKK
jgi:hypothetical protein